VAIGSKRKTAEEAAEDVAAAVDEIDSGDPDPGVVLDGSESAEDADLPETASMLRVAAIVAAWRKQAGIFSQNLRALVEPYVRIRHGLDPKEADELLQAMPSHVDGGVRQLLAFMAENGRDWYLSEMIEIANARAGTGYPDPVTGGFEGDLNDDVAVGRWLETQEANSRNSGGDGGSGSIVDRFDRFVLAPSDTVLVTTPTGGGVDPIDDDLQDLIDQLED
jgi:hypothetical protein